MADEIDYRGDEFEPKPVAPKPVLEGPLDKLMEWQAMADGAYSANTLRAQKSDGALFQAHCESLGQAHLPADPMTIRAYIKYCTETGKKPATIRRYVATIGRVHVAAGLLNLCSSEAVRLGRKNGARDLGPANPGASAGVEGDQRIYRVGRRRVAGGSGASDALRGL